MAVIELREQADGRWLIVRVASSGDTQLAWVSPESIVGCARSARLIAALADGMRACGVEVVAVSRAELAYRALSLDWYNPDGDALTHPRPASPTSPPESEPSPRQ